MWGGFMKYRSDFVTNSSSSSFIVAMKNKAEYNNMKLWMCDNYPEYAIRVFEDIETHKMTYTEALEYFKKRVTWIVRCYILYDMPEYKYKDIDWRRSDEYKQLEKKMIEEKIAEFKAKLPKRGYISVVTYGSDTGELELEQYVMPNLPFVIEVIDGH